MYDRIAFTVEQEKEKLSFLDVLINTHPDGPLGRTVYRKDTHTDLYLNKNSKHHPAHKCGVMKTLLECAYQVANNDNLEDERKHLKKVFLKNRYSIGEIERTMAWFDMKKQVRG